MQTQQLQERGLPPSTRHNLFPPPETSASYTGLFTGQRTLESIWSNKGCPLALESHSTA